MSEPVRISQADGRDWVVWDRVLYGADAEVATWVQVRFGEEVVKVPAVALGILKAGFDPLALNADTLPTALICGTYWWGVKGGDIWVAVIADDIEAGNPEIVRRILHYPFGALDAGGLGLTRISAEIALDNERAVRQARKLGFRLEGTKRQAAPNGADLGYFGLLKDECPFWTRKQEAA